MTSTYPLTLPRPWTLVIQEYVASFFNSHKKEKPNQKECQLPILENADIIVKKFAEGIDAFIDLYKENPDFVADKFSNLQEFLISQKLISKENIKALYSGKREMEDNSSIYSRLSVKSMSAEEGQKYGIQILIEVKNGLEDYLKSKSPNIIHYFRDKMPVRNITNVLGGNMWKLEPSKN